MNFLIDNPLFIKHVRSRLRKQQVMPSVIIVGILTMLIMYSGLQFGGLKNGVIFWLLYTLQGIILAFGGTTQVATTVTAARESEILDFHRVSPLPASTIAFGFLVGAPVREYVLVLCIAPFAAICALLGAPGLPQYLLLLTLLFSSCLLFQCIAMISGLMQIQVKKGKGNLGTAAVFLTYFFGMQSLAVGIAIPATLTVLPAFAELMVGGKIGGAGIQIMPKFFGLDLPIWAQSFLYQIPLTVFLFVACVRRMYSAESLLYSKTQACGFLITLGAMTLAGLIDPPLQQIAELARVVALFMMVFAALALVGAITPEAGQVANGFRRAERLEKSHVGFWDDAAQNGFIVVILALIVTACGEAAAALLPAARMIKADNTHIPSITAGLTVLYFGWALQFFHLKFRKRARSYFTLLLFTLWGVPLILGAILAAQMGGGDIATYVLSVSPLVGIATGSIVGLVAVVVPALIFGGLLRETLHQFEREITEGENLNEPVLVL